MKSGLHLQSPRAPEVPPLFPLQAQHLGKYSGALQSWAELLSSSAPAFFQLTQGWSDLQTDPAATWASPVWHLALDFPGD